MYHPGGGHTCTGDGGGGVMAWVSASHRTRPLAVALLRDHADHYGPDKWKEDEPQNPAPPWRPHNAQQNHSEEQPDDISRTHASTVPSPTPSVMSRAEACRSRIARSEGRPTSRCPRESPTHNDPPSRRVGRRERARAAGSAWALVTNRNQLQPLVLPQPSQT